MKVKKILLSAAIAVLAITVTPSHSQTPGTGSEIGAPSSMASYYTITNSALQLWANLDGTEHVNEYIYFNVNTPGSGTKDGTPIWYTNPTAWLSHNEFHLNNAALLMHNNPIAFNNNNANRKIVLYPDADNDHQFLGFGINNSTLRYQVAHEGNSHVFYAAQNADYSKELFRIQGNGIVKMTGKLSLGNDNNDPPTMLPGGIDVSNYKLFVNGGIVSKEMRVKSGWADFVFDKNYPLDKLEDVEAYIKENGRLKGMPAAKEVEKDGIELGEITKLQQQKIEELTLYIIQLKKDIDHLRATSKKKKRNQHQPGNTGM